MEFSFVKVVIYAPATHGNVVREVLAREGCGRIGAYDGCSFSVAGAGRFRPLAGAHPFIGEAPSDGAGGGVSGGANEAHEINGTMEVVDEERIEAICPFADYPRVLAAVKKVHPYEEPAMEIYPLLVP